MKGERGGQKDSRRARGREGKDSLLVGLLDGVRGVGHRGHAQLEVEGAPLSHVVHAAILLHQLVELEEVQVLLAECRLAGEGGACGERGRLRR